MDFLWDKITEWLKEMLIGGIVSNLSGMFDATNQKVAEISGQVGLSPQAWNGSIFSMIQNLSETVIVPIAGAILAFVMTLELIQLITDKNNLNDMDTWIFFKWAFKSAAAVLIVTNTWTIVMGVFDAAQSVVASASGLIIGDTSINISSVMAGIEDRLMEMELGPLFGLWFQSLFVVITMWALTICIFIITFGRMSVAFDSMWKTYTLTLKGRMTHRVELGSDARGNLVRIENALDKMPERLRSVQEQLENLYNQQAAAKAEVGKPFPQEQELAAKTARLIELDMELNLDGKGQPQPEQAIAKSARPSVLDRLKASPVHGAPEKPHKKEMEAR